MPSSAILSSHTWHTVASRDKTEQHVPNAGNSRTEYETHIGAHAVIASGPWLQQYLRRHGQCRQSLSAGSQSRSETLCMRTALLLHRKEEINESYQALSPEPPPASCPLPLTSTSAPTALTPAPARATPPAEPSPRPTPACHHPMPLLVLLAGLPGGVGAASGAALDTCPSPRRACSRPGC